MKKQSTKNPYVTNKSFYVTPDGKMPKKVSSTIIKGTDLRVKGGK